MGTDIHGKFFVKRIGYNNEPYWQDLEPAYHYRWNDEVYVHLWDEMFGTTINDRRAACCAGGETSDDAGA